LLTDWETGFLLGLAIPMALLYGLDGNVLDSEDVDLAPEEVSPDISRSRDGTQHRTPTDPRTATATATATSSLSLSSPSSPSSPSSSSSSSWWVAWCRALRNVPAALALGLRNSRKSTSGLYLYLYLYL
jgi:hypothetical protein